MHRRNLAAALLGATALAGAGSFAFAAGEDDTSATLASKLDPSKPKNVILLVGDGMGDSEVTIARYYAKGAAGRLNMDRLPFRGDSIHYVLRPGPGPTFAPNYVGDSAPTATAWSTGKRTQDNRLSQGPSSADNVPGPNEGYQTYMEIAKAAGKATGNVSTAEITDATPAGPSSHISQRACQGPEDTRRLCSSEKKSAGGLGSIAEQQVDEGFDLYLGGGRARFDGSTAPTLTQGGVSYPAAPQTIDGSSQNVIQYAQGKGYTYVANANELDAVGSLADGKKVLGLFNASNMTTEYAPLYARTDAFLNPAAPAPPRTDQALNGGDPTTGSPCIETNRPSNEPSLPAMTTKAIDLLDDDPQGFTLQVEGASIDKRDHAADICGQIGETIAFDNAVGVALDYQATHPDTLIIVTADHAHSSQAITATAKPATGSSYATLKTKEGSPLRVSYGTANTGTADATTSGSQAHTGASVPVWASGPQAANIQGTIDQTDIFGVLNGKTPSTLPTKSVTTTTTTPGPAVPGPAVPGPTVTDKRAQLASAVARTTLSQLRKSGVPVAVTALNVPSVKVTLRKGTKTVVTKTVKGSGNTTLRSAKATKGTYRVVVTGGGQTVSKTISIK